MRIFVYDRDDRQKNIWHPTHSICFSSSPHKSMTDDFHIVDTKNKQNIKKVLSIICHQSERKTSNILRKLVMTNWSEHLTLCQVYGGGFNDAFCM